MATVVYTVMVLMLVNNQSPPNHIREHVFVPRTIQEEIQQPSTILQQPKDTHNEHKKTTTVTQDTSCFI